jgi:hypothetical protein
MNGSVTDPVPAPTPAASWLRLPDVDRERLSETVRRILAHGSLFGIEDVDRPLYQWAWENQEAVTDFLKLLGLDTVWEHEWRLLQAVPQDAGLLLRLRLDATLVLLTLWYELDTAIHERGEAPPVTITVETLMDSLRTKFEPMRKSIPAPTRLQEILSLARRKNLIRWEPADPLDQSRITIWPTLRRIIPFQDLEDWTRHAQSFTPDSAAADESETPAP